MKSAAFYILSTIFFFSLARAGAQAVNPRFRHLGIADGLSQSSVYCIYQDTRGFIWVGTTGGLNRYDGYEFRYFKYDQSNPHSISSNELLCLSEDLRGNLLAGTPVGLDIYDRKKEQFSKVPVEGAPPGDLIYVKIIFKDSRSRIWVCTNKGLMLYRPSTGTLKPIPLRMPNGGMVKGGVYAIAEDAQRVLWIGAGNRMVRYDPATGRLLPLPAALTEYPYYGKSTIEVVRLDSAQNVWIGTARDGLLYYSRQQDKCISYRPDTHPNTLANDMIRDIIFRNGHAWIGSRNGLYIIDGKGAVVKHCQVDKYDPASLSGTSILCFMQDNAGSAWVGTFAGGISIEQPGNDNFSYISEQSPDNKPALNCRVISRIVEDREHNLWIATEGGGVNVYNREQGVFRYLHVNPASQHLINQEIVKSIALDEKENLWIGTLEGLFYYHRGSGAVQSYTLRSSPGNFVDEQVYALAPDSNGLWLGTKGGLFFRDRQGTLTRYRHNSKDPGSLISNDINTIIRDSQGGIWIGTESGLSYLARGAGKFMNYQDEHARVMNRDAVLCIYEDTDGNIWTGTRGGGLKLYHRRQNRFYMVDTGFGLPANIVHGIIQDRQGNLWISLNQSIARIALKKKDPPFSPKDVQVTNYSVNNGLGNNEFLTAVCRTRAGEILFGGVFGIVAFNPERLVINRIPPPVVLTELQIKNIPVTPGAKDAPLQESVTYTDRVTLQHSQAYFTIRFAALNYINARTNQYAYMLEGLDGDKQWHYVGNQQSATYTNLDAGNYVFRVKAANNDGYWNEHYTSLYIKVLPPIWKTWYAYLLYAVCIGTLLYLFYSYSMKNTRLKNALLIQQLSREKDQELAQRKLDFFTHISHEIKTPLTLVLAPIEKLIALNQGHNKALNQLMLIQRNGERLSRLTDQLLDFRKFESGGMQLQVTEGNIAEFVKEILLSFDAYAEQRQIRLRLQEVQPVGTVWFDHDKFEKVLYNLLSNALKFTPPGGAITVTLDRQDGQVELRVEDNGAGIAPQHLDKIFNPFQHYNDTGLNSSGSGIGLAFTKGLVQLHHGTIRVTSRQAAAGSEGYTCFTVTFPAEKERYAPGEVGVGFRDAEDVKNYTAAPRPGESSALAAGNATGNGAGPALDGVMAAEQSPAANAAPGEDATPVMLIVEDNKDVLSFISAHFREQFTVHTAATGKEGWDIATDILPDIIISDVMMPGMSGTDLCGQLKKDPRTSHIPIVLLTARTQLIFRIEGFETGADDYVTKPFSLSLLEVRVKNLLESRRLLRERYSKDVTLQPRNLAITAVDEVFLETVMRFIEDNISEPTLNVEELGKVVNMSRTTLYRKIKALTNQTTIEFIRSVRLKRAAQLLERNEFTVNEVAYMVGFSDVDYFRKSFKTEFDSTPKEYAAMHAKRGQ